MKVLHAIFYYAFFIVWFLAQKLGIGMRPRPFDIRSMKSIEGFRKES